MRVKRYRRPGWRLGIAAQPASRLSGRKGFTLVELMVASMILATTLLAVFAVYATANSAQGQAVMVQRARAAAETQIDYLRAQPYSSLAAGTTTSQPSGMPQATMTVAVQPYPSSSTVHLKMVSVTVSWTASQNSTYKSGSITQQSLISDQ